MQTNSKHLSLEPSRPLQIKRVIAPALLAFVCSFLVFEHMDKEAALDKAALANAQLQIKLAQSEKTAQKLDSQLEQVRINFSHYMEKDFQQRFK